MNNFPSSFISFPPLGTNHCPNCRHLLVGQPAAGKCPHCDLSYDERTLLFRNDSFFARYTQLTCVLYATCASAYCLYRATYEADMTLRLAMTTGGLIFLYLLIRSLRYRNDVPLIAILPEGIGVTRPSRSLTLIRWADVLEVRHRPTCSTSALLINRVERDLTSKTRTMRLKVRTAAEKDQLIAAAHDRTERRQGEDAPPYWHCPRCDYDWRGLAESGACPECGLPFDPSTRRWPTDQWRMRALWGSLSFPLLYVGVFGSIYAVIKVLQVLRLFRSPIPPPPTFVWMGLAIVLLSLIAGLYCVYRGWPRRYLITDRTGIHFRYPRRALRQAAWTQLHRDDNDESGLLLCEGTHLHRLHLFVASRHEARELKQVIATALDCAKRTGDWADAITQSHGSTKTVKDRPA